ncbi:threonine/serine transporter TdcC [Yersinia enterocolitica]|uniref:Threonine/serine transporter TdcC n=3 Tax=Yersinia enterocolitica TaxID=630 RepID=TDCC_YERE8|nr:MULTISPECIES: threonine/serine transporter TdcC [Yersinia]A1JIM8.1 RecName: Full=Threonine/serine transporter TdcC; AltName: Full=H(+)/threonine-serine symporter [Yersinia enterocolitica subsp. enterocolitica 8081]AJI82091.1 serine transporter family protein [Yersinia enterocolitica]AJJ24955.1 serine transporter family protein [Yersinia enterocolitica]EKA25577.1 threonine/serine transporter TdcC [Yersinia enterocolitica subsp. enterocolitica WA-314]EKN3338501.1 threonine/serine transporter 
MHIDNAITTTIETKTWRKSDTTWTLGLFGTAIGAGVLFFPIRAGFGGLIPILIMLVLAYPIAFLCHRALARLCLSGSNCSGNITETVEEHFGKTGGVVITFLYFFAICPLLWIYGVTITNTFMTFWENQLQLAPLNRGVVALALLLLMAVVIYFGKDLMVKVMSFLVFPFIACLVLISLSLIPYWNASVIEQVDLSQISLLGHDGILVTVWLGISIMVFSFNFSPIVSSFVVSKREEYEPEFGREYTEKKCSQIISRASILMVAVVMFFAFSCLFTLSPQNMAEAKAQNIPVLSYLANHFSSMAGSRSTFSITLEYAASLIALVAIFKSFFGHYLGTLEGLNGLVIKFGYKGDKTKISSGKLNLISMFFIMGSTWLVAYINPNILDLIEAMGAPIIASLLCLLPMYAIHKLPSLARFRGRPENYFVTIVGLLTIFNIVYKLL